MKKIVSFKAVLLVVVLVFAMSCTLVACGGTNNNSSKPEGKIAVIGSTSVQPLTQLLADEFSKVQPGLKIDIQGVGSTAGVKAANDGTGGIGTSSRDLEKAEKDWKLNETVIALDGIAVVVNTKNGVTDLTKEQITKIFKGEIKNWKEVGGADKEILVVSREAGSGTRGAFEELLKIQEKKDGKTISLLIANALIAEGNGAVKANVASKENGIGYLSLGMVDNSIKSVKVGGVEASVDNVKAKTYAISRPFVMLTKGTPKPEAKAFIDFILSAEGQKIVSKDYITVN